MTTPRPAAFHQFPSRRPLTSPALDAPWARFKSITRRGVFLRVLPVVIAATCVLAAPAAAASPFPHISVRAVMITSQGKRVLLIRSLSVHAPGLVSHRLRLRVSCGGCRRFATPIRISYPNSNTKTFTGVNWMVVTGHHIQVSTSQAGHLGHFLLLQVRGSRLVYGESGCVRGLVKHVPCPGGTRRPTVGTSVPGGNPQTTSGY
jgi:hypothetical protein